MGFKSSVGSFLLPLLSSPRRAAVTSTLKLMKPEASVSEYKPEFPQSLVYSQPSLDDLSTLENVFVTRSGLALKGLRLMGDSWHTEYNKNLTHFYAYALFNRFLRKRVRLNDGPYLLIHNHWCPGYYHWMTEALPRLMKARSELKDLTLLMPESYGAYTFDSLAPFTFKGIRKVGAQENLQVDQLVMPPNPEACEMYDPATFKALRLLYQNYNQVEGKSQLNLGPHLYISRERAKNRKVLNEDELLQVLQPYGYVKVNLEDYSFWDQVSLMSHARKLVSIHGAGLTNMMFMPAGGRILELQKAKTNDTDFFSSVYYTLSTPLGHHYYYQSCLPENPAQSVFDANIRVDIDALKQNLELMHSA